MTRSQWKIRIPTLLPQSKKSSFARPEGVDILPTSIWVDHTSVNKINLQQSQEISEPAKQNSYSPIKLWSRASQISPELVGWSIQIHQGKQMIRLRIIPEMIGHRLGEFAKTRRAGIHKKKTK